MQHDRAIRMVQQLTEANQDRDPADRPRHHAELIDQAHPEKGYKVMARNAKNFEEYSEVAR
jgi:hypothetical protein